MRPGQAWAAAIREPLPRPCSEAPIYPLHSRLLRAANPQRLGCSPPSPAIHPWVLPLGCGEALVPWQSGADPSFCFPTGTSSPGAADPSSRGVSVLDTGGQAGDDGEAFDFFQQQEGEEGPPTPGQEEDPGKSSEEEEALDPLGIMR